jgi:hypothetical protein
MLFYIFKFLEPPQIYRAQEESGILMKLTGVNPTRDPVCGLPYIIILGSVCKRFRLISFNLPFWKNLGNWVFLVPEKTDQITEWRLKVNWDSFYTVFAMDRNRVKFYFILLSI